MLPQFPLFQTISTFQLSQFFMRVFCIQRFHGLSNTMCFHTCGYLSGGPLSGSGSSSIKISAAIQQKIGTKHEKIKNLLLSEVIIVRSTQSGVLKCFKTLLFKRKLQVSNVPSKNIAGTVRIIFVRFGE
jgi:hypothetical protein